MKKLLFFLFLSSCTAIKQPHLCLPTSFSEASNVQAQSGSSVNLMKWWQQFHDPQLTSFIERALCCNLDLKIARERICQARGIYKMEFSYLLPWIDQADIFQRMRNSETLFETPFTGGTYVNIYQAGFDAFWEIDLFGKQIDRSRAAGMDLIAQAESVRQLHVSVAAEVASYYFSILIYQKQLDITHNHIETEQNLVAILQDRYDAGFSSELDLLTAKGVLEARYSDAAELEMYRKQGIYSLAILLGMMPENLIQSFDATRPIPSIEGKIPLGLPTDLLCRRGDVKEAEYKMTAAGARVLAAKKEMFPTLSLEAIYSFATGFYTQLFDWGSRQWTTQPSFTIPLFHGWNIRSFIQAETSKQKQAALDYELSILNALKEVENGLAGYFNQMQRMQSRQEAVTNYQGARELAEVLYLDGLSDFLFLIELERNLFFSEIDLEESRIDMFMQLIATYKALGGGWEC